MTGVGSWPGTDVREALRVVRGVLGELDEPGLIGLPYLPELPGRGPGGDLVGRGAGLLVDLPVDLQPAGWRLTDRPGRDAARTAAFWREDLDELAEAFDGHVGPLKLQVAGPWTLAASIWLPRGDRVVVDPGACRDLVASLAEGVRTRVRDLARLVPAADLVVQVDEPSLPAVLAGRLPTDSGYGRLRSVEAPEALAGLREVLAAAGSRHTVVHCCAADPPLPLLRASDCGAVGLDTAALGPGGWEGVAVAVESGIGLYAGCVTAAPGEPPSARAAAAAMLEAWARVGLPAERLGAVTVAPSCGLAGLTPGAAVARQRRCVEVARQLGEAATG